MCVVVAVVVGVGYFTSQLGPCSRDVLPLERQSERYYNVFIMLEEPGLAKEILHYHTFAYYYVITLRCVVFIGAMIYNHLV